MNKSFVSFRYLLELTTKALSLSIRSGTHSDIIEYWESLFLIRSLKILIDNVWSGNDTILSWDKNLLYIQSPDLLWVL